jgi:hypothetical protein
MIKEIVLNNTDSELDLKNQTEKYIGMVSSVYGNKMIEILSHSLIGQNDRKDVFGKGVSISFKNISEFDIGKLVFESTFYDLNCVIIYSCESTIKMFLSSKSG